MEMLHHRDCRNFAPVDVAKGICHRTKNMVPADGDQCEECVATPKFFAYPDMVALTCEMFREQ